MKFQPEHYRIIRTSDGDYYLRFWKGSHIGANILGGGLSFNMLGVQVQSHWRVLNEDKHYKIIEKIKNCKDIPIVLSKDYIKKIEHLQKIHNNPNSLINRIFHKDTPTPKQFIESFPKYPVQHLFIFEE